MSEAQFQKWQKNGNLKFKTQETYLSLANDLAEDIKINQRNLLELAKYLSLALIESHEENQMLKLEVLDFALKFQKP